MKRIIMYLITSFIMLSTANGQSEWRIVNEGLNDPIIGIDFANANTGWIYSNRVVLKTNDGGSTWFSDSVAKQSEFYEIDFINDSIGWALGRGIYKTIDGGQTWFNQKSVPGDNPFAENIFAVNESTVYILSDSLYKTIDGGTNWVDVTPPGSSDFDVGSFINADTGILISEKDDENPAIFRTVNGGETWDIKTTSELREISDIEFVNDSIGYFRAESKNNSRQRLYKTTDYFNSWSAITDENYTVHEYHFFDNNVAISVMEDSTGTVIMKSEDGGLSWGKVGDITLPRRWNYQLLFFQDLGYLICHKWGGCGGTLFLKTVNQGISWEVENFSYPIKDVSLINETKVFFAGLCPAMHSNYGDLVRTDDGFKTFDFCFLGVGNTNFSYCHFINDSIGFYSNGSLMKTSDGGESWIIDPSLFFLKDICFINETTGYTIYVISTESVEEPGLYTTSSRGEPWSLFYGFENYELDHVFFIDENSGWGVGRSIEKPDISIILKYTREQGWRLIPFGTYSPLNKIFFIDHDFGWISGGYSNYGEGEPYFLRTEDGGESWSEVSGLNYFINDFQFETVDHGWAVGVDMDGSGVILETIDGGLNWEVAIDSLSGSLHALDMKNGIGWAVGDNGLILKYSTSSARRFMVVGDMHHNSPSADFRQSILHELTLAAIKEEVDFVFLTGDLGMKTFETPEEENSVLKDWRFVLDALYQHCIDVYACRGNVDADSRETWDALFSSRYAFPQNGPESEKNLTYAINYDNLLFVALDQYTDSHKINQGWLDSILTTTSSEHIFAGGHEPAFKLRNTNCMGAYPEDRNLFWESLTKVGAKAYFSGHDHFFDHTNIEDGDSNPDNDIHQVIVGTGGGSIFSDSEYDGENGRWTPERLSHVEEHGYVLIEINGTEAEMTWKRRISPNTFVKDGDIYTFTSRTTGLREIDQNLGDLMNYPNPFHSRTIISYQLPMTTKVELSIYDLSGRKVANLVNMQQHAGKHEVEWNAEGMEAGIYFCQLKTRQGKQLTKMVVISSSTVY